MKTPIALILLQGVPLLVSATAISAPISLRRDTNAALAPRHCERDVETVATVVDAANSVNGDAAKTWGVIGGTGTWSTCRQLNHHAGTNLLCTKIAALVAAITYGAVYTASKANKGYEGSNGGPGRRALEGDHAILFNHLRDPPNKLSTSTPRPLSARLSSEGIPDSPTLGSTRYSLSDNTSNMIADGPAKASVPGRASSLHRPSDDSGKASSLRRAPSKLSENPRALYQEFNPSSPESPPTADFNHWPPGPHLRRGHRTMETISENSVETEPLPTPAPHIPPPTTYGTYSTEERSIANAMHAYLSINDPAPSRASTPRVLDHAISYGSTDTALSTPTPKSTHEYTLARYDPSYFLPQVPADVTSLGLDFGIPASPGSGVSVGTFLKSKGKQVSRATAVPSLDGDTPPSATDSGAQADEEDNTRDTPRAVTLTHDRMAAMMEATPLQRAIFNWHIEERLFTQMVTAFACDPRTGKSVGFLTNRYREMFQRLHNPLVAFGYEVQRYCMRYVNGYDLSWQLKSLQAQAAAEKKVYGDRDSGIGSDSERNCGCDSGRSCLQAGSSRKRSLTPPPRLSIPFIEGGDGTGEFISGLGISGNEERPVSVRALRKKPKFSSRETFREMPGVETAETTTPETIPTTTPSSRRKPRRSPSCPRLPALNLPSGPPPSRTSSLATVATTTSPPPKPPPLTPSDNHALATSVGTTMHALSALRDFMSELDDINAILRLPFTQCPPATRNQAFHRFHEELLPQCSMRIQATCSILLEQASIFHDILDSVSPEPLNPTQAANGIVMTGGLGPVGKKVSTLFGAAGIAKIDTHPLFNFRPFARFCCVCTRARFHVVKGLAKFPAFDGFTFWNLGRLEQRLDRLMVVDEVGDLCAMRYAVSGVAQEIIGRRGKEIRIADTEERCSVDSEGEVGALGWVGRVLGPRGRKNAAAWEEGCEHMHERKGKGKETESF
ncbi:hypothetical protein OQA88_5803 [Cercophora sp. LCS_1]